MCIRARQPPHMVYIDAQATTPDAHNPSKHDTNAKPKETKPSAYPCLPSLPNTRGLHSGYLSIIDVY